MGSDLSGWNRLSLLYRPSTFALEQVKLPGPPDKLHTSPMIGVGTLAYSSNKNLKRKGLDSIKSGGPLNGRYFRPLAVSNT